MIGRHSARSIFIFFLFFFTRRLVAQPTLPDLAGSYASGTVTLAWNCQYNGVKAISVLRSQDSLNNYEVIGFVKSTEKGIQQYEDTHPATGKNYYKLSIVFKSGLTWRSNHFGITLTPEAMQPRQENHEPSLESNTAFRKSPDTCSSKKQATVSISEDTTVKNSPVATVPPKPRIVLNVNNQPDVGTPAIKSRYVNTDPITGHVDMFLPDDVGAHHYSIKFYNAQEQMIYDVPRVNSSKLIFDKRNFQHKGVYKFVIRKDYTELETGYILVNP